MSKTPAHHKQPATKAIVFGEVDEAALEKYFGDVDSFFNYTADENDEEFKNLPTAYTTEMSPDDRLMKCYSEFIGCANRATVFEFLQRVLQDGVDGWMIDCPSPPLILTLLLEKLTAEEHQAIAVGKTKIQYQDGKKTIPDFSVYTDPTASKPTRAENLRDPNSPINQALRVLYPEPAAYQNLFGRISERAQESIRPDSAVQKELHEGLTGLRSAYSDFQQDCWKIIHPAVVSALKNLPSIPHGTPEIIADYVGADVLLRPGDHTASAGAEAGAYAASSVPVGIIEAGTVEVEPFLPEAEAAAAMEEEAPPAPPLSPTSRSFVDNLGASSSKRQRTEDPGPWFR